MLQGLALGYVLNTEIHNVDFKTARDDHYELRRCPDEVRALIYDEFDSDARFECFRD